MAGGGWRAKYSAFLETATVIHRACSAYRTSLSPASSLDNADLIESVWGCLSACLDEGRAVGI